MCDAKVILLQLSTPLILPSVVSATYTLAQIVHSWFNKMEQYLPGEICSLVLLQNDMVIIRKKS